jgi:spore germination protein GerM
MSPTLLVVLLILIGLFALGYYLKTQGYSVVDHAQQVWAEALAKPSAEKPKTVRTTIETDGAAKPTEQPTGQSTVQPDTPVVDKPIPPSSTPVDPAAEVLSGRTHLDRSGGAVNTMPIVVYYTDLAKKGTLQPVQVLVPHTAQKIQATVEQLLNTPQNLKLSNWLPPGTRVQSVNMDSKTGVATVDLSPEAQQVQTTDAANGIIGTFVYSLTELQGVKAVQVWVNGRPAVLHGQTWTKPLSRTDMQARNLFQVAPVIKFVAKS